MSETKRTSVYLNDKNKELIRLLAFYEKKSRKDILNENLTEILTKKLKKYEKEDKTK